MDQDRIIMVDKPAGMTSFGVVARIRRVLSEQAGKRMKVGHTGTLDPFATGLMIILCGKMTKKSGEFLKLDKVYEATIRLGATSTTGDPEGEITLWGFSQPSSDSFQSPRTAQSILDSFVGEITQTPPIYSAIKVGGQRAYKLARKGEKVDMPVRKVQIYKIELLSYKYPELKIRTHVSSGTYIRSLAQDIGEKLGTGAYLTELRRTKIAKYDIKNAQTLGEFGISS